MVTVCTEILTSLSSFWISKYSFPECSAFNLKIQLHFLELSLLEFYFDIRQLCLSRFFVYSLTVCAVCKRNVN